MCFFKPKISAPKVAAPQVSAPQVSAQAITPPAETPTAPEFGGSDQQNSELGASGKNKENKSGKSSLKIKLAAPNTSTTTGANLGFNTTKK